MVVLFGRSKFLEKFVALLSDPHLVLAVYLNLLQPTYSFL